MLDFKIVGVDVLVGGFLVRFLFCFLGGCDVDSVLLGFVGVWLEVFGCVWGFELVFFKGLLFCDGNGIFDVEGVLF